MECVKLHGHQFLLQPIISDNTDDDNENHDAYDDADANDDDDDDDDDDDNGNRSSIEECDNNQWQLMTLTNLNQKNLLLTCTRVMTSVHRWNIRAW